MTAREVAGNRLSVFAHSTSQLPWRARRQRHRVFLKCLAPTSRCRFINPDCRFYNYALQDFCQIDVAELGGYVYH